MVTLKMLETSLMFEVFVDLVDLQLTQEGHQARHVQIATPTQVRLASRCSTAPRVQLSRIAQQIVLSLIGQFTNCNAQNAACLLESPPNLHWTIYRTPSS